MTSIGSGSAFHALQSQVRTAVASGKVHSNDQAALSSALSDIDSSLRDSSLNGAAPSKSTIDNLISQQVNEGKLTTEQANELGEVFGSFAQSTGMTSGSTAPSSSLSTASDSYSQSTTDLSDTLSKFLNSLRHSSTSGYDSSGQASSSLTALLVNIRT